MSEIPGTIRPEISLIGLLVETFCAPQDASFMDMKKGPNLHLAPLHEFFQRNGYRRRRPIASPTKAKRATDEGSGTMAPRVNTTPVRLVGGVPAAPVVPFTLTDAGLKAQLAGDKVFTAVVNDATGNVKV